MNQRTSESSPRFTTHLCKWTLFCSAIICLTMISPTADFDTPVYAQNEPIGTDNTGIANPNGQDPAVEPDSNITQETPEQTGLDLRELLQAGGMVGYLIVALSIVMVALIAQHLLAIRRDSLMPGGLAEEAHRFISAGQYSKAEGLCKENPSFLGYVIHSGLKEVEIGYHEVEKALEDSSAEQSARLFRKIEYLNVIGTIAPMLGLLGTVWGMIQSFMQFAAEANPQVSELAPGIYKALVTTLLGLGVAIPALAAFALFRNRIDELVAETSLIAEHVFSGYKRRQLGSSRETKSRQAGGESAKRSAPPVAIERGNPS